MTGLAAEIREIRVDLPTLGKPTRPDVRDDLQLEKELFFLARPARLEFSRRLMRRGRVRSIAPATLAALGRKKPLAGLQKIVKDLIPPFLLDHRPDRDASGS